jgi:hypothetical protein
MTKQMSWIPTLMHSSTSTPMIGLLPSGSSSFGTTFVHGRNRVPNPATGRMAWVTFMDRA